MCGNIPSEETLRAAVTDFPAGMHANTPARVFHGLVISSEETRNERVTNAEGIRRRGNEIIDLPIDGRASTVALHRTDFEFSDGGFRQFRYGLPPPPPPR